jgi:mannose-binding lectin 1
MGRIPENVEATLPINQEQTQNQNQGDIPAFSDPPEEPASKYHSSAEQFADLHNRLQSMNKHIGALARDQSVYSQQAISKYDDLNTRIARIESQFDTIKKLGEKLDTIQADVRQTKSDLHNALDKHVAGLRGEVRNTHSVLTGTLAGMGTGLGKFVLVVLGSQATLIGAYLLYKRRKANSPKKYL